jgi:Fungal chitosanase of glycosyl hydrolase group 75
LRRKFKIALVVFGLVAATVAVVPIASAATQPAGPSAAQLLARVKKGCSVVSKGKYKTDDDAKSAIVSICKAGKSYVWNADMDVDCDGIKSTHCNHSTDPWYQGQTSFQTSKGKSFQAEFTHYYVIPLPSSRFSYTKSGIKPGSVAAIIYNNKVLYAVFADEGPNNIIGEASYATARDLGINPNPKTGGIDCSGTKCPVTYIVFPGVVPSPVEQNSAIDKKGAAAAQAFVNS